MVRVEMADDDGRDLRRLDAGGRQIAQQMAGARWSEFAEPGVDEHDLIGQPQGQGGEGDRQLVARHAGGGISLADLLIGSVDHESRRHVAHQHAVMESDCFDLADFKSVETGRLNAATNAIRHRPVSSWPSIRNRRRAGMPRSPPAGTRSHKGLAAGA